jgi:hypothetical protein
MSDRAPALSTPEEAKEALGATAFAMAVLSGELRRVTFAGTLYVLGADIDKLRPRRRPHWIARLIHHNERNTP